MEQPVDDSKTKYPECEKLSSVNDQRQAIMGFVLWLADVKIVHLAVYRGNFLEPIMETTDNLIYEYFGIDKDELDKERRQILDELDKHATSQETAPSHPQAGISGAL